MVEILVTLSIISIMAVIVLPQYRTGQKLYTLQRLSHKVAQDVRRTQEMTMSAREEPGHPIKYGIEFGAGEGYYVIFIDDTGNGKLDGGDTFLETITLEQGSIINKVFGTEEGKAEKEISRITIIFLPPDPIINIRTSDASVAPDNGRVELILGDKTRNIFFNKAGLIYAE